MQREPLDAARLLPGGFRFSPCMRRSSEHGNIGYLSIFLSDQKANAPKKMARQPLNGMTKAGPTSTLVLSLAPALSQGA